MSTCVCLRWVGATGRRNEPSRKSTVPVSSSMGDTPSVQTVSLSPCTSPVAELQPYEGWMATNRSIHGHTFGQPMGSKQTIAKMTSYPWLCVYIWGCMGYNCVYRKMVFNRDAPTMYNELYPSATYLGIPVMLCITNMWALRTIQSYRLQHFWFLHLWADRTTYKLI